MNKIRIFNFSFCCLITACAGLVANPTGGEILHGDMSVSPGTSTLTIQQSSEKGIINWGDFSIQEGEVTKFILPSSKSSVLNKVTGDLRSDIFGSLQANGKVYLVNPNGVFIGPKGEIKAHTFIGTTLDIKSEEFLKNEKLTLSGSSDAKILNEGSVKATKGNIILVAREVENIGSLEAPDGNISLIGGREILLAEENNPNIGVVIDPNTVKNSGSLEAVQIKLQSYEGNIFSLAVNQDGIVEGTSIQEVDGKLALIPASITEVAGDITALDQATDIGGQIHVLGEEISVLETAHINASANLGGGEILIGGDTKGSNPNIPNAKTLTVAKGALIEANAMHSGDGGKIILYSKEHTVHEGHIEARAFGNSGNGGFAEVSAHLFDLSDHPDLRAANGKDGTFLIDPGAVAIVPGTGTAPNSIGDADINLQLVTSSLIINTSGGAVGPETITIGSGGAISISWSTDNDLTFIAAINIDEGTVGNTITCTGNGSLTMEGNGGGALRGIELGDGSAINTFTTTGGNQTYTGVSTSAEGIYFNKTDLVTTSGNITINGTSTTHHGVYLRSTNAIAMAVTASTSGTISVTGESTAVTGSSRNGVYLQKAEIQGQGTADLTITGTCTAPTGSNTKGINAESDSIMMGAGGLSLTGTATGTSSRGISINTGQPSGSSAGNVSFIGSGDTVGIYLNNVDIEGPTSGSTALSIDLQGTTLPSGNIGIHMGEFTAFTVDIISSNNNPINLVGVGGFSGISAEFNVSLGNSTTPSLAGDITLTADRLNTQMNIDTNSKVTIQPYTASQLMNVATGGASFVNLDIEDTFLNNMSGASEIILGREDMTGNTFVNSHTFSTDVTIYGNLLTINPGETLDGNGNAVSLGSETIDFQGDIQSTGGDLHLFPLSTTTDIGIAGGIGTYNLTTANLAQLTDGFNLITVGRTDANNTVDFGTGGPAISFTDPLAINAKNILVYNPIISTNNDSIDFNFGLGGPGRIDLNDDVTASLFNINGGPFDDILAMGDGITISGIANGFGGFNTLDYAAWDPVPEVDLDNQKAANIFGGVSGGVINFDKSESILDVDLQDLFSEVFLSCDLAKVMEYIKHRPLYPIKGRVIKPMNQWMWQEITNPLPPINLFESSAEDL